MPMVTSVLRTTRAEADAVRRRRAVESRTVDLESLSSHELHDLAVRRALHHADVRFLLGAAAGDPGRGGFRGRRSRESEADATKVSALLSDALNSGEGEVADALRPLYIDYLTKHPA